MRVISWFLTAIGIFHVDKLYHPHLTYMALILLMCIPAAIALRFQCKEKWIKYMMMTGFILAFMVLDVIYTEYIHFLMIIPMVLASRYVTVWLGILEISTGKLLAANGGHEKPAVSSGGLPFCLLQDKHGMMVGLIKDKQYEDYEVMLVPGDKIFLYTDGVTEAAANPKERFGKERMVSALNQDLNASTRQTLENVHSSIFEFVKDAEQFDDITMVCLRYNGR